MRTKPLLAATLALTLAWGAAAKDIRTLVVTTTPQMHCQNCENKIKGNLRFEKGVKSIETNIEQQTVTIRYDADKTTAEALVGSFSKFGYEARRLSSPTAAEQPKGTPSAAQPAAKRGKGRR